ncbi:MAG: response regulator, partial [Muribaculaceae bacterium]|nr:response regulator [Muribaculaceae bacterium]
MPEDADGSTILIVEDDADLLKVMERLLARYYNVLTASSAEKACEIVSDNDVDLIISDMIMPEMGGVEFCRFIKGNIESSHIPVLLLTANTMEEAEVDAYEAGADGFMPKPFSLNVLMARISNLLRIRKAANRDFRGRFAADLGAFDYSQLDEGFLKDAVECITAHIDDPGYSQTMFIQEMGVSKSTLFRKLKSLTGLSYSSFVRNIRLKTACRIMRERRDIRISELAYAVGFNDPKYFSLCFRKEFGILPSEYMERLGRGEDL